MSEETTEQPALELDSSEDTTQLEQFVKDNPGQQTEVLYTPPPSYGEMNPDAEGSWQWVVYKSKPVGLIWTDWNEGAGIVASYPNEFFKDLHNYLRAAFSIGVPASSAYTSLGAYVLKSGPDGVELSESDSGVLAEALDLLLGEPNQPETDNGDE